jgi:hypothetical protein
VGNVPAFDQANRSYFRSRTADIDATAFIQTTEDGAWTERPFLDAIRQRYPTLAKTVLAAGWMNGRVVFDADNQMYTLLTIRLDDGTERNVLLHSPDRGQSYRVYELPPGRFAQEFDVGANVPPGPPMIGIWSLAAVHPGTWADYYNLWILQPELVEGEIVLREPTLVTDRCLGMSQHSGSSSFAVTRDGKTHIVWTEATEAELPGAPTFVATYDHVAGLLGEKQLVLFATPMNDLHATPGITIDSQGFLHVVGGSHGESFQYSRSMEPNNAYQGWTEPIAMLNTGWATQSGSGEEIGRQTYVSLVCDRNDTLHVAFRQSRRGVDAFHQSTWYSTLSYQRKTRNGAWEGARILVVPPLPEYAIYYQALAVDRIGRLFLSFSYISGYELAHPTRPGRYFDRTVIVSDDGGDNWRVATTSDFLTRAW